MNTRASYWHREEALQEMEADPDLEMKLREVTMRVPLKLKLQDRPKNN